jgi:glycogen debranching enzyme
MEINTLWDKALGLVEGWLRAERGAEEAQPMGKLAKRVYRSFNARFWYAQCGHLHDVIDGDQGDDQACRPNQVFVVSLPNPVIDHACREAVLSVVRDRLLTPVGLRSLAPGNADYKAKYHGDPRSRDAAYHQGTVRRWLIGPFIDPWLDVHPEERSGARCIPYGLTDHLAKACIGSVGEVFDAEPPFMPGAAWPTGVGVAEVLRCCVKSAPS